MLALLLVGLALAKDAPRNEPLTSAPARPPAQDPVAGECADAVGFEAGATVPAGLFRIENGAIIATCSAVALPNSMYVDLENDRSWALQLETRYTHDIQMYALRLGWAESRIEILSKPTPWWARPETQRWAGRIETTITFVAVGFLYTQLDKGVD